MPTRDRPELAARAIRYFLAQDYPRRELVIVEQGAPVPRAEIPPEAPVRVFADHRRRSIGQARNMGCRLARGAVLAQWDDDDWYGPERLSRQVEPLLRGVADVTALRDAPILDLGTWTFWRCSPDLHRQMFRADVLGGTLVYRRAVWDRLTRYPDASLAEDATFLTRALRRGARLSPLPADGVYIYLRHGTNTWSFRCGEHLDPARWRQVAEPPLPAADRAFYRARAGRPIGSTPLVSCIMPTRNRRAFVPRAVDCFRRQDHPARELVIVDDGDDPIASLVRDLAGDDPAITYHRLPHPLPLGPKRNLAVSLARGELIAHWDDDDWSAPHRLRTR